jgi:uncharacterized membrane protein
MWRQTVSTASGLSTGVMIGIISAAVCGIALIGAVVGAIVISKRKKHAVATNAPMFQ